MNRGLSRGLPREYTNLRGLNIGPLRSVNVGDNQSGQQSGFDNVVIGDSAAIGLRATAQSVVIGSQAAASLDWPQVASASQTSNVIIGYQAAATSVTSSNVAIGFQVGMGTLGSGGGNSVAVGATASAAAGSDVAIGSAASANAGSATAVGASSVAGPSGVSVGTNAGHQQSTAPTNTFIGNAAGYTATPANATTTGTRQTCIGNNSGQNVTSVTALNDIVCLGDTTLAGANNVVVIGSGASATASGAIAIGRDSAGTAATSIVADEIVLGTALSGLRLGNLAGSLSATTGFPYMPVTAGTPTGVPVTKANYVPFQFDSTGGKLWAYYGAAWHFAAFT